MQFSIVQGIRAQVKFSENVPFTFLRMNFHYSDGALFKEEWAARSKRLIAAKKKYDRSNTRYYEGNVTYIELFDAQRSLREAQLSLFRLTQRKLISILRFYKTLGGGLN